MVAHERLAQDVARATYANGTVVYVNYRKTDYAASGVTIPALDYIVEGGGGQ